MISCDLFRNVFNLLLRRDSIKKHCAYLTSKFKPYMTDDPFLGNGPYLRIAFR